MIIKVTFHLYRVREEKNYSIRRLADISGVSKSQIERIELNQSNPTITTLCMLAKALDVPPSDLYSFE